MKLGQAWLEYKQDSVVAYLEDTLAQITNTKPEQGENLQVCMLRVILLLLSVTNPDRHSGFLYAECGMWDVKRERAYSARVWRVCFHVYFLRIVPRSVRNKCVIF